MTSKNMRSDERRRADDEHIMDNSFDPKPLESKWYARWEQAGLFAPQGDGAPYCILLPPPNVTGTLHMGHAFQQTVMDALIRYHRMRGFRTLWQGGTDHAGIATQKIVENQLAVQGKTRHDLGREAFVARVWEWKQESGSTITHQMRRLGASVDWSDRRTSSPCRARRATISAVRRSSRAYGSGNRNRARPSRTRCAASARRWTGQIGEPARRAGQDAPRSRP